MDQSMIFGPFFAMMFLTLVVWVYMYIRRISFITASKLSPKDLAVPGQLARLSPPAVSNPSDNLKNLFEIPVLFYALVLYLFAAKRVDAAYVDAAWVFVAFRAMHSAVHCTFNLVMLRFYLYLFSTLTVWFIAIRAALALLRWLRAMQNSGGEGLIARIRSLPRRLGPELAWCLSLSRRFRGTIAGRLSRLRRSSRRYRPQRRRRFSTCRSLATSSNIGRNG